MLSAAFESTFMSTPETPATPPKHQPFVPDTMQMKEFTFRAVFLGLLMTIVLGAANAYLGLRAGITIAATYPAAVIGMAVLRIWKGSVLEENIARTSGTIGEGIAAGTRWEDIPINWTCPECGARKEDFEMVEI